jgi:hypothetical protein
MMTHDEIVEKLYSLGFEQGWSVRNGKIVVWENKVEVPAELNFYIDLDGND